MIRINLLQEGKSKKGKGPKVAVASTPGGPPTVLIPVGIGLVLLVGAILGFMYFSAKKQYEKLKNENVTMQKEIDVLKPFLDKAKNLEKQKQEVENRINQIKALKSQQQGPVYLMSRLYETKPEEGVWFLEIKVDDPQPVATVAPVAGATAATATAKPAAQLPSVVHIKGVGKNFTIVNQFVSELERHRDWFPSVTLKGIKSTSNSEAGLDGREFDLDVAFAAPSVDAVSQPAAGVTP